MKTSRLLRVATMAILLAVSAIGIDGARPEVAAAHPLGDFTVNRYARLELYREVVHMYYALDFAEIPTLQLVQDIDRDRDGKASATELDAFRLRLAPQLSAQMRLTAGSRELALLPVSSQASFSEGQAGLDVLRVVVVYAAGADGLGGPAEVRFVDRNYEDRVGWKEIVIRPSEGSRTSFVAELLQDRSDALQTYPESALTSAPDMRSASITWDVTSGAVAPAVTQPGAGAPAPAATDRFTSLLDGERSVVIVLASLLAAFGFGALHALGPGHGKAVVAAYLVGSKGTVSDAVTLGLTVTATHTSMVYVLGFATIAALAFIVPERLYLYLGLASGVSVVAMGAALFVARAGLLRRGTNEDATHRHGLFGAAHSHAPHVAEHAHDDPHARDHDRVHGEEHLHGEEDGHAHARPDARGSSPTTRRVSRRGLLALGVIGGLLPCPSALVVMLAAIAVREVLCGMLLIVAFSAGLASVLTGIGVALVLSQRLARRLPALRGSGPPALARAFHALPAASALAIVAAGVLITQQALRQFYG